MKRLLLLTLAVLVVTPCSAAIYKYRDIEGRIHFSDKPMKDSGLRLVWRTNAYDWPSASSKKPARVAVAKKSAGRWNPAKFKRNVERFTPLIDKAAQMVRLRPELLHAVVRVESGYDPNAVSKAGAIGLMQLMPETAQRYGVNNAKDPKQNIQGGARYLRDLLEQFNFNLKLALAAYNAGENSVVNHGNQIPPFAETRGYVKKVLDFYLENRIKTASSGKTAAK